MAAFAAQGVCAITRAAAGRQQRNSPQAYLESPILRCWKGAKIRTRFDTPCWGAPWGRPGGGVEAFEERLFTAYKRIRSSVKNGLAVVPIQRGASGGSFFTLPPQVQVEIASRKRITTDEHSGRILVDPVLAEEETEKMQSLFDKLS